MNPFKSRVRRSLEATLGKSNAQRLMDTYQDNLSPQTLRYRTAHAGRRSITALRALQARYAGQRCFIIGNGPSVAEMDLTPLRHEYTFALNRGYLLFDRMGGPATFLVAVNRHVIEQFGTEILQSPPTKFLSWHSRDLVPDQSDVVYLRWSRGPRFCEDVASQGAWEGATVTFVAMQLAFHMGFREVVLVGVDHSFASTGEPHKLITSQEADPNHFDPQYFGPGVRWQLPDLETSEIAYRLAVKHFAVAGRRIVDATIGGQAQMFSKAEYSSLVRAPLEPAERRMRAR